jgi:hypothetical protein
MTQVFYCQKCRTNYVDPNHKCLHNKYNATRVQVDGKMFDSQHEANRYVELCHLQRSGKIGNLECQTKYEIIINDIHIGYYIADFSYIDRLTGRLVAEDAKGFRTALYKLKKKIVEALYGLKIREV